MHESYAVRAKWNALDSHQKRREEDERAEVQVGEIGSTGHFFLGRWRRTVPNVGRRLTFSARLTRQHHRLPTFTCRASEQINA